MRENEMKVRKRREIGEETVCEKQEEREIIDRGEKEKKI
jgi:hypothetical protein